MAKKAKHGARELNKEALRQLNDLRRNLEIADPITVIEYCIGVVWDAVSAYEAAHGKRSNASGSSSQRKQ